MVGLVGLLAALGGLCDHVSIAGENEDAAAMFGSVGYRTEPPSHRVAGKPSGPGNEAERERPSPPPELTTRHFQLGMPEERKQAEAAPPMNPAPQLTPPESALRPQPPQREGSGSSSRQSGHSEPAGQPGQAQNQQQRPPEKDQYPKKLRDLPNGWQEFAVPPEWVAATSLPPFPNPALHGITLESCTVEINPGHGATVRFSVKNDSQEKKSGNLGAVYGPLGFHEFAGGDRPEWDFPFSTWYTGAIVSDSTGQAANGTFVQANQMGVAARIDLEPGQKVELFAGKLPAPNLYQRCGDQIFLEIRHPARSPVECMMPYKPSLDGGGCLITSWDNTMPCRKAQARETKAFKRCSVVRGGDPSAPAREPGGVK